MADIDLTSLPHPQAIETLSYETILAERMAAAQARFDARGVDYNVGELETDPVKIAAEAESYREMNLRARVNDGVKANIVSFSEGADLEALAASHGVTRLTGETDIRLRQRIVLKAQGSSAAGPEERYEFLAMTADVRIADVKAYRIGEGPQIGVSVLSSENGGVPDEDMLDAVDAAINVPTVRGVNDVIVIASAVGATVNVAGQVWLLPNTPQAVVDGLAAALRAAWAAESGIGFDFNRSWAIARLHVSGVAAVVLSAPTSDVVADDTSAIALGTINLTFAGVQR